MQEVQMLINARMYVERAEAFRVGHEKKTIDPCPTHLAVDYGCSGSVMDLAKRHLDESVPNGQKERTECAFKAMELTMQLTRQWLIAKGFDV